ncbi:hypothetical protein T4E_2929 [Trichinella pseudospiralis]|uniref:Integrase zinc-binding domain-containing protein n=1 Tax=Trichinella pseudospiralis TaxID=6337 RepID=A0A0V0XZC1_TRIPS|nr:hypothetical protein T4E_2929 [Trichinella pseudospiralis]
MDLQGFSDASGSAYGAVVYLRLVHGNGKVEVRFLAAKSRVAPIKKLSLPRLELMAALLCARLITHVKREADLPIRSCFCWSDSSVARCWIRSDAQRWKPFVANRVREIQEVTSSDWWRHCPTQDNQADLASRGRPVSKLSDESLWDSGPREGGVGAPKTALIMTTSLKFDLWSVMEITRYGSYGKLIRVTAWCLRFISNARLPMETWIRQVQVSAYGPGSHRRKDLQQFNPCLDEDGILRVGGRLTFAELPQETRNPILLPHGDEVVKLLIQHVHEQQLHAGVNQTLAATRRRFWITRGRSAVKDVQMAELPPERTEPVGPFVYVGVDFAGPILARSDGKSLTLLKTYVCVFTCMVVRAIHLELVPDMTVDSFLRALRRFISRRGRPRPFGQGWDRMEVLGRCHAKPDKLRTVLCEIEARINDRPLTIVSDRPDDQLALTPAHFLIGR